MIMKNKSIAVFGDVMLDEYWEGTSTRLSPEFPVPVIDDVKKDFRLGGAANVALTCRVFSNDVTLYGVVGNDQSGETIRRNLLAHDIKDNMLTSYLSNTITKLRVTTNNQQVCRIDSGNIDQSIYISVAPTHDVVIISDYDKGSLSEDFIQYIIEDSMCKVIIDPKGENWDKYNGAYCLTPNLKEFEQAYGKYSDCIAKQAIINHNLQGLLITKGSAGLTWVGASGDVLNLPSIAREVFDVTGAGDAVIATLGAYLHMGITTALYKANNAAGAVVAKRGTSLPMLSDVEERVVFTNGCFDIIHSGHVAMLEQARALGTKLIVGLNSDASVERIKRTPINNQEERKRVLESIQAVDEVIIFDEDTPELIIRNLNPSVLVKGGDYTIDNVVGHDLVDEVVIIPTVVGKSTTNLIERIKNNE